MDGGKNGEGEEEREREGEREREIHTPSLSTPSLQTSIDYTYTAQFLAWMGYPLLGRGPLASALTGAVSLPSRHLHLPLSPPPLLPSRPPTLHHFIPSPASLSLFPPGSLLLCLIPSLPPCLSFSLPSSLPPSLPPTLPSLPPTLPASLPPSLPPSQR